MQSSLDSNARINCATFQKNNVQFLYHWVLTGPLYQQPSTKNRIVCTEELLLYNRFANSKCSVNLFLWKINESRCGNIRYCEYISLHYALFKSDI